MRALMSTELEDFKKAHERIDAGLKVADGAGNEAALLKQLLGLRDEVLAHFRAKDAFYPALASRCEAAGDTQGAHLTRIFETNMKVQSGAVQRFFQGLEQAPLAGLPAAYRTVAGVIRQRFGTEEKAVFPLFTRSAKSKEKA